MPRRPSSPYTQAARFLSENDIMLELRWFFLPLYDGTGWTCPSAAASLHGR